MRLSHLGTFRNSEEVESVAREWLRSIAVAARSKAWVYGRSLAGNAGLIPAGGMDMSLSLSLVSVVCRQVDVCATGRSLVQGNSTECVIYCDKRNNNRN